MSSLILAGDTSGAITLTVPTSAGTNTITLPASTGTLITTASTSSIPGTVNWTTVQTSSVSPAVVNTGYPMNTTSGALTVTLPAAPVAGNLISIVDYAGTAASNNITINPNGNRINGNTNNALISVNRQAVNLVYVDSTQGWLAYSDVYSTGNPVPQPYTISYLIVAGGGGGKGPHGGGGGAGGLLSGTTSFLPGTVYTATVGAGGTAVYDSTANSGSNSSLTGITAASGGGGGGALGGVSGGSGGGGGGITGGQAGGAGTSGQGNAGGSSPGGGYVGSGGGGGRSAVGNNASGQTGGAGGAGLASSITGASVTYAGGGGGGSGNQPGNSGGAGGAGGGGTGSSNMGASSAGTANLGGGGGGGGGQTNVGGTAGSNGGSGVVILSVPTANYSGVTTGSPSITTSGSNTIIRFTSSGTYTG